MNAMMRRRGTTERQSSEPQFEPFPVEPWRLKSGISSTGGEMLDNEPYMKNSALCETYFPVIEGQVFKRTTPYYDSGGFIVNNVLWEYSKAMNNTYLRRSFLVPGTEVTVGSDCKYVRFTCSYQSATGKTMTQAIIDQYFGVVKKR